MPYYIPVSSDFFPVTGFLLLPSAGNGFPVPSKPPAGYPCCSPCVPKHKTRSPHIPDNTPHCLPVQCRPCSSPVFFPAPSRKPQQFCNLHLRRLRRTAPDPPVIFLRRTVHKFLPVLHCLKIAQIRLPVRFLYLIPQRVMIILPAKNHPLFIRKHLHHSRFPRIGRTCNKIHIPQAIPYNITFQSDFHPYPPSANCR